MVCKAVVETSRAAGKTQALQLGLKEEDLATGEARVCNTCWCKTLKKKHSAVCPVPTCTSNKVRSRGKLRHLPKKWGDLTKEARDTVMADLGLPEKTKHVCAACFTRITRRISQLECEPGTSKGKKEEEVNWAEDAIEKAKGSLRQYGTNWTKMAEAVRDKTEDQCKKFFYNQRKRLQLDKVVQEYKRANRPGGDDKPSLTSDEESGSSTSSGEEDANNLPMEVDPAEDKGKELKPPAVPPPQEQRAEGEVKKAEDYNSADTMSADETGEVVGGPTKKPAKGMKTVEGLVEAVIKNSLPVQGATTSVASVAVTTATQSLNTLLRDAGPSPRDLKNYVRDTVRDGPHAPPAQRPKEVGGVPVARPEQELQPGAGIALGQVRPSSDGVIDFSMTRPERSSPAPASGGVPLEHGGGYHSAYNKLPREPMPESAGKEPPAAHGGQKPKTSHKDILMMSMNDPAVFFRPDSKSPAPGPYTDPRSSVHSPGPHMVIRGDPRNGIPSLSIPPKPPLHPTNKPGSATPSHPPSLTVTPSRPGGSLMEGTPKVRPPHGAPAQASPRYDPAHHTAPGGSIIKGQPVYRPQDAAPRRQHPTHAQDSRASSHPSMEVYKAQQARGSPYPSPYPPSRPASHEQPGLPRSSRSIIEGDYSIAQSMQKHPRDPPSSGFPRTIDPHRRDPVPAVDPRLDPRADPRGFYPAGHRFGAPVVGRGDPRAEVRGDPRAELPGARGDPRAEIPRARGDPRDQRELVRNPMTHELTDAMGRPVDPRVVDPRAGDPRSVPMLDPRVPRGAPQLYPGYPDPRAVPRPRSPPRQSHPQTSAASPSGSILTGQPKHPREANPYPRHPEVSITKSLPGGARPEGYAPNLDDLARLAETQQRLPSHPSAREGPGRPPQGAMMDGRGHFERPKNQEAHGPPRGGPSRDGTQQRIIEQAHRDQTINKQQEMISRISQMSEQDQKAYLESLKNSSRNQPDHMSAANLIDLIITHQINRNTVVPGLPPGHPAAGPPGSQNPRRSPQAPDGKESPNKMPSASPSVKNLPEGLEVSGPSGSGVRTSPGTMGEHIENMISKEVGRGGTGSPYPGTSSAEHEHWKRRGYPQEGYRPPSQPRPPSNSHAGLSTDERVIQRVVQNASPASSAGRPDKPPSRSMHEAISPPTSVPYPPHTMYPGQAPIEPAMAKFFASARRKEEAERAAVSRSGAGVSHFDDYVKYKITEVMKNEKSGSGGAGPSEQKPPSSHAHSMGPPHKRPLESEARGSPSEHPPGPESPNKRYKRDEASASNDMPDSPESGDMVIDESARPDSAHSQKTNSPAPAPPAETGHYPPGFRGAPAQPPRSSPAPTGARPPPQPSQARYEPLSDDD